MALRGIKVIEFLGLAPGPLCGTILADFGASVTVIQKIESPMLDVLSNGKKVISLDLKTQEGVCIAKKMCATSDVVLDTFRPGIMEKIGLGPEVFENINRKLIYARLTGYGQMGLYKERAGHDINYVAMSGILSLLGRNEEPPAPPLNLLADFGGGGVLCSLAIVLALFERTNSGKGQIIDCAMTQGLAYLATWVFKSKPLLWQGEPGTNLLDGGFPFYRSYKTKDGKFMAVGALEPQFYQSFLKGLQLPSEDYIQTDVDKCRNKFVEVFLTKTQAEWCQIFDKLDACVTPVLETNEIDEHEYHKSKNSFYRDGNNTIVPEPSPILSRTPGISASKQPKPLKGQHTVEILKDLGYNLNEINELIRKGCVFAAKKSNL